MATRYVFTALGYALLGLTLGLYMAASQNHAQMVTHAHILLIGFVISFVYATIYRLWPINSGSVLVKLQFYLHQAGIVLLGGGLFLLYGSFVEPAALDPVLGLGGVAVLLGMIMMQILFIKASREGADDDSAAETLIATPE